MHSQQTGGFYRCWLSLAEGSGSGGGSASSSARASTSGGGAPAAAVPNGLQASLLGSFISSVKKVALEYKGQRYMRCYAAHALDKRRVQQLEQHMQLLLQAHTQQAQQVQQGSPAAATIPAEQPRQQQQQQQQDALAGLSALLARCAALLPSSKSSLRHSYVLAYYLADLPGRRYLETLQVGRAGRGGAGQAGRGWAHVACTHAARMLHACCMLDGQGALSVPGVAGHVRHACCMTCHWYASACMTHC